MSDFRELKQHVLTFEKSYQSRFPESRRLYNKIVHEYAARMQNAEVLQGGAWYNYAADSVKDAYGQLMGREPSEDAMRRHEEMEQYMENVVAPGYRRGYQRVKDAAAWTAKKAAKGYRGAKWAYNWTADTWLTGKTMELLTKLREEADKKAKKLKNSGKQAVCRAAKRQCNMISVKECEKSKAKLLRKISKSIKTRKKSRR